MIKRGDAISATLVFLVFLVSVIFATGIGRCPKVRFMDNFDLQRFTGRWYEIERSFYLMQVVSSCVSVDLNENVRGQLEVDVKSKSRWSGGITVSEGVAFKGRKDPSLLNYKVMSKFPRIFNRYLPGSGQYQVVDTDYKNYAILWSCTSYHLAHTDLLWIWARQREIDAELRAKIYEKLEAMRLDSERLYLPQNGDCIDD